MEAIYSYVGLSIVTICITIHATNQIYSYQVNSLLNCPIDDEEDPSFLAAHPASMISSSHAKIRAQDSYLFGLELDYQELHYECLNKTCKAVPIGSQTV